MKTLNNNNNLTSILPLVKMRLLGKNVRYPVRWLANRVEVSRTTIYSLCRDPQGFKYKASYAARRVEELCGVKRGSFFPYLKESLLTRFKRWIFRAVNGEETRNN